jgi:hypothetical protein
MQPEEVPAKGAALKRPAFETTPVAKTEKAGHLDVLQNVKTRELLSDGLTELGSSGKSEQSCNEPDDVPLLPPRIGVARDDPAVVRRVRGGRGRGRTEAAGGAAGRGPARFRERA